MKRPAGLGRERYVVTVGVVEGVGVAFEEREVGVHARTLHVGSGAWA